jgi:hypothetical protein
MKTNKNQRQLALVLQNAAHEVENEHPDEHAKAMAATAGAVPSWLTGILKMLGPAVLAAVQAWIASQLGTATPPATGTGA